MTGPLGVTHLLLFSRSPAGNTNLRIALTPRGPTLHFRVESYALCKDVKRAMKRPKNFGSEYLNPPLLVMNNFFSPSPTDGSGPSVPKHLETLTTTVFQSLFPAISPQNTPLSSIRRILLLNRELPKQNSEGTDPEDPGTYIINVRHYAITTKRIGLPKPIRRINAAEKFLKSSGKSGQQALPNLSKLEDVADYLLDPTAAAASGGFTSGSESEAETDAEVEVLETQPRKVLSRKKIEQLERSGRSVEEAVAAATRSNVEKKAVKLTELGPRMKLKMTKVEEGVCAGKTMWHDFITKTKEEEKKQDEAWEKKNREKAERKKVQKENVERKRKEREGKEKGKGKEGDEDGEEVSDEDEDEEEWYSDEMLDGDDDDGESGESEGGDEMEIDPPKKTPLQ